MKEHTTGKREFVVGESNNDAWNDVLRAAVFPDKFFNPLFICGQSEVGKTLLLSIIGDVVRNRYPLLHVEQTGTIELCDEIVEAICKDSIHEFREKFSSIDVLLVDDIQFVAEKTQHRRNCSTFLTVYVTKDCWSLLRTDLSRDNLSS